MDIIVIINQMVILFLVIALGYFLCKIDILDEVLNKRLSRLLLDVAIPAVILSSVMSGDNGAPKETMLAVFIVVLLTFIILPFIGYILARLLRAPIEQQGLYTFMTVFTNMGFMGFPVAQSIFGDTAVFYVAVFNMGFNIFAYTMGIILINMGQGTSVKLEIRELINPGSISSVIALIIYFTGISIPTVLAETTSLVGSITTPCAMLLIGGNLAQIPVREVFNEFRIYPYTLFKQILIPIMLFPVLETLIADRLLLGVTFIMIAMPVGNTAALFASEYGRDVKLASKIIFLSTLVSVVTIPAFVYAFLI